jgi:FkbM family methyltransferase
MSDTLIAAGKRTAKRILGPSQIDESGIAHAVLRDRRGTMLDVGAHYGHSLAPFASDGWTVHAFEPDPRNRAELEKAFGDVENVTIVPKGVADRPGTLPLFTSPESSGISSFAPFTTGHSAAASVETVTLRDYLAQTGIEHVDFLKIDVEGFELPVLHGYDWAIKPDVIVLEFEDFKTLPLGYSWQELAEELVGHGYQVLVSEWFPVERYGGAGHAWRRFARYPTELLDSRAWGNLIAAPALDRLGPAARSAVRRSKLRRGVDRVARR